MEPNAASDVVERAVGLLVHACSGDMKAARSSLELSARRHAVPVEDVAAALLSLMEGPRTD